VPKKVEVVLKVVDVVLWSSGVARRHAARQTWRGIELWRSGGEMQALGRWRV
jgi:hypothetical protein